MVTMTMDGKPVSAEEGTYLLQAAKKLGITIPALCAHGGLEPFSACRLCMVEVRRPEWEEGRTELVTACSYPVEEGLIVSTSSAPVLENRKRLFELLLARCPETEAVKTWAAEWGVESTPHALREEPDDCILCGICIRVCEKVGAEAISTTHRGKDRLVEPPFGDPVDCIGCLACAHNCPTGHITYTQEADSRTIWGRSFEMEKCPGCEASHVTVEQVKFYRSKFDLPEEHYSYCNTCKQNRTAGVFMKLSDKPVHPDRQGGVA